MRIWPRISARFKRLLTGVFAGIIIFSSVTEALCAPQYQIVTEDLPPYSYIENGKATGITLEIVRAVLHKMEHPDNIKFYSWSRAYNLAVQSEEYILFSVARSSSREKLFKWVGPLLFDHTVFYARKGSGMALKSIDDAKKVKSIGTYKNDVGDLLLRERGFTNLNSVLDDKFNVQKLVAGRIDLWITSELIGRHTSNKMGLGDKIERVFVINTDPMSDSLYMAFNKKNPDKEVARWQKALDAIKADGTYEQILRKYDVKQ